MNNKTNKKLYKNGLNKTSKFWQKWKNEQPMLDLHLTQVAIGMILGDAGLHRPGKEAYIKFEQGYAQKDFIYHLYDLFKGYTFMEEPGIRYNKGSDVVKSYWFKTFLIKHLVNYEISFMTYL